jgi:hypothetical protein
MTRPRRCSGGCGPCGGQIEPTGLITGPHGEILEQVDREDY